MAGTDGVTAAEAKLRPIAITARTLIAVQRGMVVGCEADSVR